jgi:hypothetical protein
MPPTPSKRKTEKPAEATSTPTPRPIPRSTGAPTMTPQQWATQQAPTVAPNWATVPTGAPTPGVVPGVSSAAGFRMPLSMKQPAAAAPEAPLVSPGMANLPPQAPEMYAQYTKLWTNVTQAQQARATMAKEKVVRGEEEAHKQSLYDLDVQIQVGQLQLVDWAQQQPWVSEAAMYVTGPGKKQSVAETATMRRDLVKKYPFIQSGGVFGAKAVSQTTSPNQVVLDDGTTVDLTPEQAAKRQANIARQAAGEPTPWEQQKFQAGEVADAQTRAYQQQLFNYNAQQDAQTAAWKEREWAASQAAAGRAGAGLDLQRQQMMQQAWQEQMQYGLPAGPSFQPGWQPGGPVAQLSGMSGASFTPRAQIAPQSPLMPQQQVTPEQAQAYLAAAIAKFR